MSNYLTTELYDYQKNAANFSISRKGSISAMDTSAGKSITMIGTGLAAQKMNIADVVINVVTASAKISLYEEYEKHTNFLPFIIDKEDDLNSDFDTALMQYERFEKFNLETLVNYFKDKRVFINIDEFHTLKNPNAKTTQTFYILRQYFDYVTGYTGTPITSSISDIFYLSNYVKPGCLGTYETFMNNFIDYTIYEIPINKCYCRLQYHSCFYCGYNPIEIDFFKKYVKCSNCNSEYSYCNCARKRKIIDTQGYKNIEYLKQILNDIQYLYFPHKNINFIPIYYNCDSAYDKYVEAVSGTLEDYNLQKLDKFGNKKTKMHSSRMIDAQYTLDSAIETQEELLKLLPQILDRGALIYGNYYETINNIEKNLKKYNINYRNIDGRTNVKQRKENKDWFSDNTKNKVAILSKAGGQSLNLQATNNLILYNLPYTIGEIQQLIGRVARLNSVYKEYNIYFLLPLIKGKPTLNCYKFDYASANKNLVCNLFNHDNMFEGALLDFNSSELRQKRREMIWSFSH